MLKQLLIFVAVCVIQAHCWTLFGDPRINPLEEVSEQCLQHAARGSCEFYTCLERRFPCGHSGYAIKIGRHFCEKGLTVSGRLTPEGRTFFNRSNVCLTEKLIPVYSSFTSRCGDITDESVSAIIECSRTEFNGMSFCSFIRDNSEAYNSMYGLDEVSRLLSLRKPSLLARLFVDGSSCGAEALSDRMDGIAGHVNDAVGSVVDSWNTFSNRMTNWFNN